MTDFTLKEVPELDSINEADVAPDDENLVYDASVGVVKRVTKAQGRTDRTVPINSVASFGDIDLTKLTDRQAFFLVSFGPTGSHEGGPLYWDESEPRANHDGRYVFSPTVPAPADFNSATDVQDYRDGVGDSFPGNNGCFIRAGFDQWVIPLPDITYLSSLNTAALVDNQQFYRGEFWPGTGVGAVNIKWDPNQPVANHNGGTIIDPAKISELNTTNKTFGTYFTADTVSGGTGCFVVASERYDLYTFGGLESPFDSTPVFAAMDSARAAGSIGYIKVPEGGFYATEITVRAAGFCLFGVGPYKSRIFHPGTADDVINISSENPAESRIREIAIRNISVERIGGTVSSAGAQLHLVRPQICFIDNVALSEGFGSLFIEGGTDVYFNNFKCISGNTATTLQAGSYFMKLSGINLASGREFPSEIFVSNFNLRAGPDPYIQDAIIVEATDGVFFSNGHCGFTQRAALLVRPTNATDSVIGVNFSNTHFDGNFSTLNGVLYDEPSPGFHTGAMRDHTFTGCQSSICTANGVRLNVESLDGFSWVGGRISSNSVCGVDIVKGSNVEFSSKVLFTSNGDSTIGTGHVITRNTASGISVDGVYRGAEAYRGVQINDTSGDVHVSGRFSDTVSEDVFAPTSNKNIRIAATTDRSSDIASATALDVPLVGNVFNVTGTTDITSISGFSLAKDKVFTLFFDSSLTVFDGGNLALQGDFPATPGDSLTLISSESVFREISRSQL